MQPRPEDDDDEEQRPQVPINLEEDPRVRFMTELDTYVMQGEDGVELVWDQDQHAWFPKYDDDLLRQQQSAYDFSAALAQKPQKPAVPPSTPNPSTVAKRKRNGGRQADTSVYVTGLPPDTTLEEVHETFSKCGLIAVDVETQKPRIKLYRDPESHVLKGDALITFFKSASVELALTLLDDSELRPNAGRMRVEKATFEKDSEQQKQKQPSKKMSKAMKRKREKHLQRMEKRLQWNEDDDADEKDSRQLKAARTCILKHMFHPKEFNMDPGLILELKADIQTECEKLGQVTTVKVYENHPDGVVAVRYLDTLGAKACVKMMEGRFFAGRQIKAFIDDGRTAYASAERETEQEEQARLERYAKYLEAGGEDHLGKGDGDETPDEFDEETDEDRGEGVQTESEEEEEEEGPQFYSATGVRVPLKKAKSQRELDQEEEFYFEEDDEATQ